MASVTFLPGRHQITYEGNGCSFLRDVSQCYYDVHGGSVLTVTIEIGCRENLYSIPCLRTDVIGLTIIGITK